MKRVILVLVIGLFIFSTTLEEAWGQTALSFTEVVTVDSSMKKNDLFTAARAWVNKSFASGKDVTQIADKESGEISVKGVMSMDFEKLNAQSLCGYIHFSLSILIKDGKYKYTFSDFKHEAVPHNGHTGYDLGVITTDVEYPHEHTFWGPNSWYTDRWNEMKVRINSVVSEMKASLKAAMNKKVNSDW